MSPSVQVFALPLASSYARSSMKRGRQKIIVLEDLAPASPTQPSLDHQTTPRSVARRRGRPRKLKSNVLQELPTSLQQEPHSTTINEAPLLTMSVVRPSHRSEGSLSPPPLKRAKHESTTTNQVVKSFFTPSSQKTPDQITWRVLHGSLLVGNHQPMSHGQGAADKRETRRKIAAFDLDSTLITTKSGNTFSRDAADWKWWHLTVPTTIRQLHADGFLIVILTNQGKISLQPNAKTPKADQRTLSTFKTKVASVLSHFDFPMLLLAATLRDIYRKPRAGMWKQVLEDLHFAEGEGPDVEGSIFVGDAGGRAAIAGTKADHSCVDRDLAANIGIKFTTPEEYFLREEPRPFRRDFDPKEYLTEAITSADTTPIVFKKKNDLEIVIMCGSPGCGKSTFYWTKLKSLGYTRVNQDSLKTRDNCIKAAKVSLNSELSVAIDNTNADTGTRSVWVSLAKQYGIPIRCVWFTAAVKLCEHNATVRALAGKQFNPEKRAILPHSAFHSFKARFKEPKVQEGFEDITRVDFHYQGDEEGKKVWSQYWV